MKGFNSAEASDPDRATVESAFTQLLQALADEATDSDRRPGDKWLKRFKFGNCFDREALHVEYMGQFWYPDVTDYGMEGLPAVLVTDEDQLKLLLQTCARKDPRVMASAWYHEVLPYGRVFTKKVPYRKSLDEVDGAGAEEIALAAATACAANAISATTTDAGSATYARHYKHGETLKLNLYFEHDPDIPAVMCAYKQLNKALEDEEADPEGKRVRRFTRRHYYFITELSDAQLRMKYYESIWIPDVARGEGLQVVHIADWPTVKTLLEGFTCKDPRVIAAAWHWDLLPEGQLDGPSPSWLVGGPLSGDTSLVAVVDAPVAEATDTAAATANAASAAADPTPATTADADSATPDHHPAAADTATAAPPSSIDEIETSLVAVDGAGAEATDTAAATANAASAAADPTPATTADADTASPDHPAAADTATAAPCYLDEIEEQRKQIREQKERIDELEEKVIRLDELEEKVMRLQNALPQAPPQSHDTGCPTTAVPPLVARQIEAAMQDARDTLGRVSSIIAASAAAAHPAHTVLATAPPDAATAQAAGSARVAAQAPRERSLDHASQQGAFVASRDEIATLSFAKLERLARNSLIKVTTHFQTGVNHNKKTRKTKEVLVAQISAKWPVAVATIAVGTEELRPRPPRPSPPPE